MSVGFDIFCARPGARNARNSRYHIRRQLQGPPRQFLRVATCDTRHVVGGATRASPPEVAPWRPISQCSSNALQGGRGAGWWSGTKGLTIDAHPRILIAEDHALVRDGLKELCAALGGNSR